MLINISQISPGRDIRAKGNAYDMLNPERLQSAQYELVFLRIIGTKSRPFTVSTSRHASLPINPFFLAPHR